MRTRVRHHWWVPVVVLGAGCAVWAASPVVHAPTGPQLPGCGTGCQGTPDAASLCPGGACVLNPQVTQATINSTICQPGWTATIRPPAAYTSQLKVEQMRQLGLAGSPQDYEEDHRMPLELGGNPSDPHNLTPEPHASSNTKDASENAYKAQVCSGQKTLAQAQADFIHEWLATWPGYAK